MIGSHPAAEIFPELPAHELKLLADDIRENGLREPIVLHDGRILDGRNRWKACQLAGVTPETVQWSGECGSPVSYVMSLNLHRRHLETGQRAAIAVEVAKLFEGEARDRSLQNLKRGSLPPEGTNSPPRESAGKSIDRAADAAGVSASSAKGYKRLTRERPDLAARVVAKELTLNSALKLADAERRCNPASVAAQEKAPCQAEDLDETGQKVPQHLQAVFAARADFDAILGLMKQVVGGVKRLADVPAGVRIQFNAFKPDADNARNAVTFARPHAVCRPCKGAAKTGGKDCPTCKGSGWLTKDEFARLPKSGGREVPAPV